jgi:hypothetical protein
MWQEHNTCLDLPFQPRYRGFSMCSVPLRIAFLPEWLDGAAADDACLGQRQMLDTRILQITVDEYDSAHPGHKAGHYEYIPGCLLEILS